MISETGAVDQPPNTTASWIVRTLTWVKRAMREGVPVEGYFVWTLTDNYEWNHGMSIRMGLYAVDKDDPQKTRVARSAVDAYGRIAQAGEIPRDLAKLYPAP